MMMPFRKLAALLLAGGIVAPAWAQAEPSEGEVRKVDQGAGKITLRHGPIRNLDMPPMTMVFTARDPALLDKVKAGDKVKFSAEQDGGTYLLTAIEAQP
jgi:Cu/Ag efflux protein CusF